MTTSNLLLASIGTVLTGSIESPIEPADSILVEDGRIAAVGTGLRAPLGVPVLDCGGATVLPGLIDNHVHPVFGDYTPRQSQSNYLEGFVHGGVTSAVSAGEVHLPGRPKDVASTKALALLASSSFRNFRPSGLRVHGGALMLEPGLQESDFEDLAAAGVNLVGEIGISGVQDPEEAAQMTRWAQAVGMTVMVHVGGKSVPTSRTVDAAFCAAVRPDIAAHVNGGPTAPALADVERILDTTEASIEVVFNGNPRAAVDVTRLAIARNAVERLVLGTDSPAGAGIAPAGILRTMSLLCAMGGLPAPLAVACATGNTARARRLDTGRLAVGAPADLLVADTPDGSHAPDFSSALETGDTPAVAAVVIGGELVVTKSRNTAPPKRTSQLGSGVLTAY